jgi:hypothetical protein
VTDTSDDPELAAADNEELEAARLLALALDGRSVPQAPREAVEAAALLRTLHQPELSDDRAEAILKQLLAETKPQRQRAPRSLGWSLLWASLSLSALLLALWREQRADSEASALSAPLPPPSVALLEAQAARLQGGEVASYEQELLAYRKQVMSSLRGAGR